MTEILTSVIKPKLTFFQVQVEGAGRHSAETIQSRFCISPEAFNTVDVIAAFGKFVLAMINPKMLAVTHIDQTIIATPTVRVDDAAELNLAPYHRL